MESSTQSAYAVKIKPGPSCQELTPVEITVSPDQGGVDTKFVVTVHWEDLTDDELKDWQGIEEYHATIFGEDPNNPGRINIKVAPKPTERKPVNLEFTQVIATSPLLAIHLGPGRLPDPNCDGYQAKSVGINYDVSTLPTPSPTPVAPTPDSCSVRGRDCTYDASVCGACANYSCQVVLSGGPVGRDRRACKPIPPATPTPEPGQLKLGDACNETTATSPIAKFRCEPGVAGGCIVTDVNNGNGICGGPEAVDLANRCRTDIDSTRKLNEQIGKCAEYRNDAAGKTTQDTLTPILRCGTKSSGVVCKNPEARLCLANTADGATADDLRCQVIPPAKSPCKEGLTVDGVLTTTPALIAQCTKVGTAVGDIQTNPFDFLKRLMGIILSLSGGIALILIIFSGYQILMSEGNPEKLQGAKDTITSAIIGLVFMIFSMVILQLIGVDILHIPMLGRQEAPVPTRAPLPPGERT